MWASAEFAALLTLSEMDTELPKKMKPVRDTAAMRVLNSSSTLPSAWLRTTSDLPGTTLKVRTWTCTLHWLRSACWQTGNVA